MVDAPAGTSPAMFERLAVLIGEIRVRTDEANVLATRLVTGLADYEQMITGQPGLGIRVPCGFRPSDHRNDRRNNDIFWRVAYVDEDRKDVVFTHECGPDHYAGCSHEHDKWLRVPILFFTHPQQWLLLTALAGEEAR